MAVNFSLPFWHISHSKWKISSSQLLCSTANGKLSIQFALCCFFEFYEPFYLERMWCLVQLLLFLFQSTCFAFPSSTCGAILLLQGRVWPCFFWSRWFKLEMEEKPVKPYLHCPHGKANHIFPCILSIPTFGVIWKQCDSANRTQCTVATGQSPAPVRREIFIFILSHTAPQCLSTKIASGGGEHVVNEGRLHDTGRNLFYKFELNVGPTRTKQRIHTHTRTRNSA